MQEIQLLKTGSQMTTDYQDKFKTLKSELKKTYGNILKEFIPDVDYLYDGKIDRGTKRVKLYSKDFVCSRCKGSSCFYCPDKSGEKWLACSNLVCMKDEAAQNKR
jgi:hypothetical protein